MRTKKTTAKLPSDKLIAENKDELAQMLRDLLSGHLKIPGQRETVVDKLTLISDILTPFKQEIESGKLKYTEIAKVIAMKIQLNVSPATLRMFCQAHLGFSKSKRKAAVKKAADHQSVSIETQKAILENE